MCFAFRRRNQTETLSVFLSWHSHGQHARRVLSPFHPPFASAPIPGRRRSRAPHWLRTPRAPPTAPSAVRPGSRAPVPSRRRASYESACRELMTGLIHTRKILKTKRKMKKTLNLPKPGTIPPEKNTSKTIKKSAVQPSFFNLLPAFNKFHRHGGAG